MTLYDEIQKLKTFECNERCVLSVYLNTNPADLNAQNGAWKIHLKNGLKRLEEYLTASNDGEEIKNYKALRKKVEKEIADNQNDLQKGVVIFASTHEDLWSVHYVQVAVKTSFHWETEPVLDELRYMYKAYPYTGIVLPSSKGVRIIDTSMGIVNEEIYEEFDANLHVETEQQGGGAVGSSGGGGSPADQLDERVKENLDRFYKEMASKVVKLKKDRHWDEVHIVGETDHAKTFAKALPNKPTSSIYKNMINISPGQVIHEVFEK